MLPNLDIDLAPGVTLRQSPRAAKNRYDVAQWLRFIGGKPEKIGGWTTLTTSPMRGIPRGIHSWNDLNSVSHLAAGTEQKLYWIDQSNNPIDITPYTNPAGTSITNAMSTVSGSNVVTIVLASHGLVPGQGITFGSVVTIGGLTIAGSGSVASVIDNNTFTFLAGSVALATATNGGGTLLLYFDIPIGATNPTQGLGYGAGVYGVSTYGTARAVSTIYFRETVWTLDHFGQLLLANRSQGPIYKFDPTINPTQHAGLLGGDAPGAMMAMFVTTERFVFALGSSADTSTTIDPMLVRWPDQGTLDTWTPTTTNTANSRRLQAGKQIVAGASVGGSVSLVWTDSSVYLFQYTGSRFVYNSRLAGSGCGLSGPLAFAVANGQAYWFSINGFFMWNGSPVPIPGQDDVKEYILQRLRDHYESKVVALYNPRYNEVWFLFVLGQDTEPSFYAAVKLGDWFWITGTLTRSCATRVDGQDNHPLMAGADGNIYQHEYAYDGSGAAIPYKLRTTVFGFGDSTQEISVTGFMPDWDHLRGPVNVTLEMWDRTGGDAEPDDAVDTPPIVDTQTVTVTNGDQLVDMRVAGRYGRLTIEGTVANGDMRLGVPQIEYQIVGGRR